MWGIVGSIVVSELITKCWSVGVWVVALARLNIHVCNIVIDRYTHYECTVVASVL